MTAPGHTMRAEPPTAAEVHAVARLWEHRGGEYVPGAPFLAMRELGPDEAVPIVLRLDADDDGVSIVREDGRGVHSEPLTDALHVLVSWCAIGPDGPLSWARVAELVAEMSSPVVTRPAEYDGGAVCTRCNGARVVDGDACVCAGGAL